MTWLSIVPAVLTIALAVWTKRILPSLLIGVLVGCILKARSVFSGFPLAIEYVIGVLADKDNLHVLLFLYLFSALVQLIQRSGGIKAFTEFAGRYIHGKRGVLFSVWGLIPLTFIDCGFRVVASGSILRSLAKKHQVANERMAFMLNNTASPAIELIPIATTFVVYNVGIIQQGLSAAGAKGESAYRVLIQSIPYQFFSLVVIPLTFATIFFGWKRSNGPQKGQDEKSEMSMEEIRTEIQPKILNLVIPMALVIIATFTLLAISGLESAQRTNALGEIIKAMEIGKVMLVALFISLLGTSLLYFFQGYSLEKLTNDVIEGGNGIMPTLAILVLAWPLSKISQDLGLGELVKETLAGSVSSLWIPVSVFLVSAIITYFIGSSWGAQALVMPVAIPLAIAGDANVAIIAAAVITGGTYGDVTSPVAGMVNMAANVARANRADYVRRAFVFNTIAAGIAAILFVAIPWLRRADL